MLNACSLDDYKSTVSAAAGTLDTKLLIRFRFALTTTVYDGVISARQQFVSRNSGTKWWCAQQSKLHHLIEMSDFKYTHN